MWRRGLGTEEEFEWMRKVAAKRARVGKRTPLWDSRPRLAVGPQEVALEAYSQLRPTLVVSALGIDGQLLRPEIPVSEVESWCRVHGIHGSAGQQMIWEIVRRIGPEVEAERERIDRENPKKPLAESMPGARVRPVEAGGSGVGPG